MSARTIGTLIAGVLLTGGAVTESAQGQDQKYALVIGITGYPEFDEGRRLNFADDDARLFADFLYTPEGGAFPTSNVRVLTNDGATRTDIAREIEWLRRRVNGEDLVYVFFSGHGVTDELGIGYLMPYDADDALPSDKGWKVQEFVATLQRSISSRYLVAFIDACHAGAAYGSGLAKSGASNTTQAVREAWEEAYRGHDALSMAFLSAAANQRSWEDPTLDGGHGVFAWYLVQGLKGAADNTIIGNRDGTVTAQELYRYVLDNVERHSADRFAEIQSPTTSPEFSPSFPLRREVSTLLTAAEQARTHFNLGYQLAENGDHRGAMREYRATIQLEPDHVDAHNNIGVAYVNVGDTAAAMDAYREAIRINPNYALARSNLAFLLLADADTANAVVQFRRAIELDPTRSIDHNELGRVLLEQGHLEQALRRFRAASAQRPEDPIYYNNIGYALERLGDFERALSYYREALRLRPNYAQASANQSNTIEKQKSVADSVNRLRERYAADPRTWHDLTSYLHETALDFRGAYEVVSSAATRHADSLWIAVELAEASLTSGRTTEAQNRIASLLLRPDLALTHRIVLLSLRIVGYQLAGDVSLIPVTKAMLRSAVQALPEGTGSFWLFDGTTHFIRRNTLLSSSESDALIDLLRAVETGQRAEILRQI